MNLLIIVQDIFPFIMLAFITLLIEFNVKYKLEAGIENFYIRGIRILILIFIAIKLNGYGGIYTYISFILTYIICAILDHRYRNKFEKIWGEGTIQINKYINKNKNIKLSDWVKIRYSCFKKNYRESYNIFTFKIFTSLIIIFIVYIITVIYK